MAPKIALQLYSLRELTKLDFEGVIRKIAAIGYDGVEVAGLDGTTLAAATALFQELGLTVVGAHMPFPIGAKKDEILDTNAAFGCKYMIVAHIGPDDTKDMDAIKGLCARANEAQANARDRGMTVMLHNHWWEYAEIEGKLVVDHMLEFLDPEIMLELDTYWIKVAGQNPVERVVKMGQRSPVLHIKDGTGIRENSNRVIGTGIMDVPALLKAGGANTKWWVMEADLMDGDPYEFVRKSYEYMKGLTK